MTIFVRIDQLLDNLVLRSGLSLCTVLVAMSSLTAFAQANTSVTSSNAESFCALDLTEASLGYPSSAIKLIEFDYAKGTAKLPIGADTSYYEGHFDEYPILPGKEIIHALFQLALEVRAKKFAGDLKDGEIYFLSGVESASFSKRVEPESVELELSIESLNQDESEEYRFSGRARAGGGLATRSEFSIARGALTPVFIPSRYSRELSPRPYCDRACVMHALPHGDAALRIDQVKALDRARNNVIAELLVRADSSYAIALNEQLSLLDGKDIIEAMAQTAGLLDIDEVIAAGANYKTPLTIFRGIKSMNLYRPVILQKEEHLILRTEAHIVSQEANRLGTNYKFNVRAWIGDLLVAEGEIEAIRLMTNQ